MRYAVASATRSLLAVAVIFCCLRIGLAVASSEVGIAKQEIETNDQMDMSKRGWSKGNPSMMHSWGKRAWQNLQGGWGKRDLWGPSNSYPLYVSDKRAWQNLQGGWGKRFATDEEYAAKLAALLSDEEQLQQQLAEYNGNTADGGDADIENNEEEKRGWRSLNSAGWGKRAQWGNFRGSWGKRDPAWTNLKGIWGKRSFQDRNAQ